MLSAWTSAGLGEGKREVATSSLVAAMRPETGAHSGKQNTASWTGHRMQSRDVKLKKSLEVDAEARARERNWGAYGWH